MWPRGIPFNNLPATTLPHTSTISHKTSMYRLRHTCALDGPRTAAEGAIASNHSLGFFKHNTQIHHRAFPGIRHLMQYGATPLTPALRIIITSMCSLMSLHQQPSRLSGLLRLGQPSPRPRPPGPPGLHPPPHRALSPRPRPPSRARTPPGR